MPPVMAFHLGSLGFLTPFNFENFQSQVTQVIEGKLKGTGCGVCLLTFSVAFSKTSQLS